MGMGSPPSHWLDLGRPSDSLRLAFGTLGVIEGDAFDKRATVGDQVKMKKLMNAVESILTESLEGFRGGACRSGEAYA
jgi:hypothetical protein